jgi:hypothetical protein
MVPKGINCPTLRERVLAFSEEELLRFARQEASASAASSLMEGVPLDAEELFSRLVQRYRAWRAAETRRQRTS